MNFFVRYTIRRALVVALIGSAACADPECPEGYTKIGAACRRPEAGTDLNPVAVAGDGSARDESMDGGGADRLSNGSGPPAAPGVDGALSSAVMDAAGGHPAADHPTGEDSSQMAARDSATVGDSGSTPPDPCLGVPGCVPCSNDQACPDPGACLVKHCNNAKGICEPEFAASATACGTSKCDGAGHCVGCLSDQDCGAPGECKVKYCNPNTRVCEPKNAPTMTSCSSVPAGRCDGAGSCTQCLSPGATCTLSSGGAGVCNDRNACVQCNTVNDCKNSINGCQERQCTSGVCSVRTRTGDTCTGGRCNNLAECVECIDSSTCPSTLPHCVNSACRQCGVDADCGSSLLQCKNNACVKRCGNGIIERSASEDCELNVNGWTSANCALCRQTVYVPAGAATCTPNQADTNMNNYFGPGNCPVLPGFSPPTCLVIRGLGCYISCNSDANCPIGYHCSLFAGTSFEGFKPPFAGYCQ